MRCVFQLRFDFPTAHIDYITTYSLLHLWLHGHKDMDGATHSSLASFLWSSFSFVLSIDVRSRKELAEDWVEDKDGLLVFVRRVASSRRCSS
jgi:hypothetical protein